MWRTIPICNRVYEAHSQTGQIRRRVKGHGVSAGKILKQSTDNGYQKVKLAGGRRYLVHRLVLMAHVGQPPKGKPLGLHSNGDASDNRLSNLRWGTASDNALDAVRHGTNNLRNNNPNKKLTPKQVREVRVLLAARTLSLRAIGRKYGVTHKTISALRDGVTWGHI